MMKSFLSVHINLVTTTQFSRTRLGAGDKHGMTKVVTDGFVAHCDTKRVFSEKK